MTNVGAQDRWSVVRVVVGTRECCSSTAGPGGFEYQLGTMADGQKALRRIAFEDCVSRLPDTANRVHKTAIFKLELAKYVYAIKCL